MARLPFSDPDPPAPAGRKQAPPLSVTQASVMLRQALSASLPDRVRIIGQVSNLSARNHWFFSLKDEKASLRCVMFASAAQRVRFDVRDGMELIATGRIDYFPGQGQVQLYVDRLEPVGVGELELRYRALCDELKRAGYFEIERKRPLPAVPRRVAVITSRSGAALQDVINTACKRWAGCSLTLTDVRVQGEQAAPQVARAINALSEHGPAMGVDVVILTRGGGSIEDLWAFNERAVAEAIFNCSIPVVAAIGHETDTTIAELVADVRCATPTQAAMQVVPDRLTLEQQVDQLSHRMKLLVERQTQHARQHLESLARRPHLRRPEAALDPIRERLGVLSQRLTAAMPRLHRARYDRLKALARQLQAVSPTSVLDRGYSYTLGPDGHVLKSPDQAPIGTRIKTVLAEGELVSRVESEDADAAADRPAAQAAPQPSPPKPRRKRGRKAADSEQPRLF